MPNKIAYYNVINRDTKLDVSKICVKPNAATDDISKFMGSLSFNLSPGNYLEYGSEEMDKFVKGVTKSIRLTESYKDYISSLKETDSNMTRCVFFDSIAESDHDIEMHHHPMTMYEIISVIVIDLQERKEIFNEITLMKYVMHYHKENIIGLIPVTHTAHRLIHNRKLYPHVNHIFGNWVEFIKLFRPYISNNLINSILSRNLYNDDEFARMESMFKDVKLEKIGGNNTVKD